MSFLQKRIFCGLGLAILSALLGCGSQTQAASNSPQGVFIDSKTISFFQAQFDEVKACSQFSKGSFSDLSVIMMPPSFPCPYYSSGCSGEYAYPNLVKIGQFGSWKHEVIHYLLNVNTGDPDTDHKSSLFQTCAI